MLMMDETLEMDGEARKQEKRKRKKLREREMNR